MISTNPNPDRLKNKTDLLLKFNYISSLLSLVLGLLFLYVFDVRGIIMTVFFSYFALNMLNIAWFNFHGNLTKMALCTSLLSLVSTFVITLFSGGINSPFIFVLAVIVLAGYVSTRVFGKIYLYIILAIILVIFLIDKSNVPFVANEIPTKFEDIFSLASILFAVYLLGGVFGKELLRAHHDLYRSKAEIEERVAEKETLLKEVHHRVKNNLQSVSSLLSLQTKNLRNTEIQSVIKSSKNRIMAMAMVHEMLYERENLSNIEFGPYVKELTQYLSKSVNASKRKIIFDINIPKIVLAIDTAIALGLIINEIVTNSLKYGFDKNEVGHIDIVLTPSSKADVYSLVIGDDGKGFGAKAQEDANRSLGLKLIHNLARQLKGSVEKLEVPKGTRYELVFQDTVRQ